MPNIKSAKKRVKIIETKTAQNYAVKKAYKEAIKAYEAAVEQNSEEKTELYKKAIASVDKACSKNVLAKNTASRKKAILSKKLNKKD